MQKSEGRMFLTSGIWFPTSDLVREKGFPYRGNASTPARPGAASRPPRSFLMMVEVRFSASAQGQVFRTAIDETRTGTGERRDVRTESTQRAETRLQRGNPQSQLRERD